MIRKEITVDRINNEKPLNSRLTAMEIVVREGKKISICRCKCGNVKDVLYSHVLYGKILSCGCYKKELARPKTSRIEQAVHQRPNHSMLTPIGFVRSKWGRGYNLDCTCKCGGRISVSYDNFVKGRVITCGCKTKPIDPYSYANNKKIHNSWQCMINRCYRVKDVAFSRYGGRGVKVCDEWKDDYRKFIKWSLENGWKDGLQLDKDILGAGMIYSPETCKWVTPKENMNHKRNNKRYNFKGKDLTVSEIADKIQIPKERLYKRIEIGISGERLFYPGNLKNINS